MPQKLAADIMVPTSDYPHIPDSMTLIEAMKITRIKRWGIETRDGLSISPRAMLVFNEDLEFVGMVRRRDIMRGLLPGFLARRGTRRKETFGEMGIHLNVAELSFDRANGDLYIGDVGQGAIEEISYQPASSAGGENYGWNTMEGTLCFSPSTGCDATGLVLPAFEYDHGEGCSVTGGPVYRGNAIPELDGHYFFGDWCAGWVKSFQMVDGQRTNDNDWRDDLGRINQINGMGTDADGEIIVVTFEGNVLRIVPVR